MTNTKNTYEYTGFNDQRGNKIHIGDMFIKSHGNNWTEISIFEVIKSRKLGYIGRTKDGTWFPIKQVKSEIVVCGRIETHAHLYELSEEELKSIR